MKEKNSLSSQRLKMNIILIDTYLVASFQSKYKNLIKSIRINFFIRMLFGDQS
jgi:hypothetical protein